MHDSNCIKHKVKIYGNGLYSVLLTQYCAGDKIEKNEMGWACGSYGGGEGGVWGPGGGNRRERDRWGDLGLDGWIILGWISRRWVVGMGTGLG